jgi:solute carrier family 25 protein 33/36
MLMAAANFCDLVSVVKTRLQLEARHRERSQPSTAPKTSLKPLSSVVASPDVAKSKMLPAFRVTRDILRKEGFIGLYKGMSASYLGVTEGVIQWVLYEVGFVARHAGIGGGGVASI